MATNDTKFAYWTCTHCTFSENKIGRIECKICSNKRSNNQNINQNNNINQWKCNICSLFNNENTTECDACETVKPFLNATEIDLSKIWHCVNCLMLNSNNTTYCIYCGTKKEVDVANRTQNLKNHDDHGGQINEVNKWECIFCTYLNEESEATCEMCGEVNTNLLKKFKQDNQIWSCKQCSHKNRNLNTSKCEMCGYDETKVIDEDEDTLSSLNYKRFKRTMSIDGSTTDSSINNRRLESISVTDLYDNDIKEATKLYDNIINYCRQNLTKFVDDAFPPCDKSLFLNPKQKPEKMKNRVIQWLPIEQIQVDRADRGYNWTVFHDRPAVTDIKQGSIGDCWFLSGLAVTLEIPKLIENIFITKQRSPEGCYMLRLFHNGEWKMVIVDDSFPCDENGYLLYSKAVKKKLWVVLVEKAYAKLNDSYGALIGGFTNEALSTFTGYPCENIRFSKFYDNLEIVERNDIIWANILSNREAGFLLACSTGSDTNINENEYKARGLESNHAYSILEVKDALNFRLIQIKNPWGHTSWNGDWSNNSPLWTPELKSALDRFNSTTASTVDNGIFWMSFEDFLKYFSTVYICKIRDGWMESHMSGYFVSHDAMQLVVFKLFVLETTQIDLSLFHKSNKHRKHGGEVDMSFIVLNSKTHDSYAYSCGRKITPCFTADHIFQQGEYTIVPISFNFWHTKNTNQLYNLVLHGQKSFLLEQKITSTYLLADCLIQLCLEKGKKVPFMNGIIYIIDEDFCGLIIMVENFDEKLYFHVKIDSMKSVNMVSTRDSLITSDAVPPMRRQVLILLTQLEVSEAYITSYSYEYQFRKSNHIKYETYRDFTNYPPLIDNYCALHQPRRIL